MLIQKNFSQSNSQVIRAIRETYGVDIASASKAELRLLVSENSRHHRISSLSDLMLGFRKFDIENMSTDERNNLKYLALSTKELSDLIDTKSRIVYYKPCETRLRRLMSYQDFRQSCYYKLLLNDGILKFDANYRLDPAIYCWVLRNAIWLSKRKATDADEIAILDAVYKDTRYTYADILLKDEAVEMDTESVDALNLIKVITDRLDKTKSPRIRLKVMENCYTPYSEFVFAVMFIKFGLSKREMSQIVVNSRTLKPVANKIFNNLYKKMVTDVADIYNDETGSSFRLDPSEL